MSEVNNHRHSTLKIFKNIEVEPTLRNTVHIEDIERGAELSFSGPLRGPPSRPLRGPCIIVKFCFQTTKFWFQTDGRTDGQTQ